MNRALSQGGDIGEFRPASMQGDYLQPEAGSVELPRENRR